MGVFQANIDCKRRWPEFVRGESGWVLYLPFLVLRRFYFESMDTLDYKLRQMLETQNLMTDGRLFQLPALPKNQEYIVRVANNRPYVH